MHVMGVRYFVFEYLDGSTIIWDYAPVFMSVDLLHPVHTGLAEMTST